MAKVVNNILISLLVFFLVFCWLQYYAKMPALSFFTAVAAAILSCAIFQIATKKPSKKQKTAARKKQLDGLTNFLTFSNDTTQLFSQAFEKKEYTVKQLDEKFLFLTREDTRVVAALCFDFDGCPAGFVVETCKKAKALEAKPVVLCGMVSKGAFFAAQSSGTEVHFAETKELYTLLESSNLLPQLEAKVKKRPHIALCFALNKKRFGYYLGSAFFLVAISFLSYFPLYNLIWATALAVLAVFCLVNKRFNVEAPQKNFWE